MKFFTDFATKPNFLHQNQFHCIGILDISPSQTPPRPISQQISSIFWIVNKYSKDKIILKGVLIEKIVIFY